MVSMVLKESLNQGKAEFHRHGPTRVTLTSVSGHKFIIAPEAAEKLAELIKLGELRELPVTNGVLRVWSSPKAVWLSWTVGDIVQQMNFPTDQFISGLVPEKGK